MLQREVLAVGVERLLVPVVGEGGCQLVERLALVLVPSVHVAAEVVVVEPTGAETELLVKVGGQQLIIVIHGRTSAGPGPNVYLTLDPAKAHVFDAASNSCHHSFADGTTCFPADKCVVEAGRPQRLCLTTTQVCDDQSPRPVADAIWGAGLGIHCAG